MRCDIVQPLNARLESVQEEIPEQPVFADFRAILESGMELEKPTVAEVIPGVCLLYAGRINEIHGEPATGKTNLALGISLIVMQAGGTVLYMDPEDNPTGICRRLVSFGAGPDLIIDRFKYSHNPAPADFPALIEWTKANTPALVVLDGLAEALASEGMTEDKAGDILGFFRLRARPFADAGSAVLLSDHVTKSTEGRGRWARGSGAKLGRYDGVSYSAEIIQPYSPTVAGAVRLVVSKDRCGGMGPAGMIAAEIAFQPSENGTIVTFRQPEQQGEWMPTALMQRISDRLAIMPDSSNAQLRELGKAAYVDQAIKALERLGHLTVTHGGKGRPTKYKLVTPYHE